MTCGFVVNKEDPSVLSQSKLGKGGFGEVWRYEVQRGERILSVAVKFMNFDLQKLDGVKGLILFWNEWLCMSNFSKCFLVKTIGMSTEPELPKLVKDKLTKYVATNGASSDPFLQVELVSCLQTYGLRRAIKTRLFMECFEGRNLAECLLDRTWTMDVDRFREISARAILGVSELHESQMIHNDLKPPNFLLRDDGFLKICDFGAMTHQDYQAMRYGYTPVFVSPERERGAPATTKSDIFSLGVTLGALVSLKLGLVTRRQKSEIEEILFAMTHPDPTVRPSAINLTKYGFFRGYDWERLRFEAERESERKSGQAAADDFDGPGEGHGRRMAIRR